MDAAQFEMFMLSVSSLKEFLIVFCGILGLVSGLLIVLIFSTAWR